MFEKLIKKLQDKHQNDDFTAIVLSSDHEYATDLLQRKKEHGMQLVYPRDTITVQEKAKRMANRRGWTEKEGLGVEKISLVDGIFIVKDYRLNIMENRPPILMTKTIMP